MTALAVCMSVLTGGVFLGVAGAALAAEARPRRRGYVGRHRATY
ncbi:hypothetical protein [Actinomadura keratinilytica]